MSAREGSIWVESGKLAYTDENGEKKTLDFDDVKTRVSRTENKTQENETTISSQSSSSGDFSFSLVSTNSPVRFPGEFQVTVSVTNDSDNRVYDDIVYIFDGVVSDVIENEAFDAGEERQFTFRTFVEEQSEISSSTPPYKIGASVSGICRNAEFEQPSDFDVTITSTNSPVTSGNSLDITADITNQNTIQDTQTIELDIDDTVRDSVEITLGDSETQTKTLSWSDTKVGNYTAEFRSETSSELVDVSVTDSSSSGAYHEVKITSINEPTEPDNGLIDVEVANLGGSSGSKSITLDIDGTQEDSQSVSLSSGEVKNIQLTWSSTSVGLYDVTVSSPDSTDRNRISVLEGDDAAYFAVDITGTNSPVEPGNTVNIEADIINLGSKQDSQTITLTLDEVSNSIAPNILDSSSVSLNANQNTGFTDSVKFSYKTPSDWTGKKTFAVASEDDIKYEDVTISEISTGGDGVTDDNTKAAGIIIHEKSENTLEGTFVDKEAWIEIYGQEVHFSQT